MGCESLEEKFMFKVKNRIIFFMIALFLVINSPIRAQDGLQISRAEYADHLRAMWLGESIANWTGLNTEGQRPRRPFYTDEDWGSNQGNFGKLDFIFQDPWGSDDDTDIEYIYLHLMTQHDSNLLTPEQIAEGWKEHINDFIWVSNRQARDWMNEGVLPPATGMGVVNSDYLMIDAQLTTEIFGALAPEMPSEALRLANLPIRTTAAGYAAHAAQFFVVLYSLAPLVDRTQSGHDQVIWLVEQARQHIPDTSKTADIADFVLGEFLSNPDPDNWERTRDRIAQRYQRGAGLNGFVFREWWESSVNFATGLMALLYGQGDFKRTVQIGMLSGWDSDNGTATMGGLLGLMMGSEALAAQFPDVTLSDRYHIYRTRDNLPDYLPDDPDAEDTFTLMGERMLPLVDRTIAEEGGSVNGDSWVLPPLPADDPLSLNPLEQEYRHSANNQIRLNGGTIETRMSSGEGRTRVFADGWEHNFFGLEELQPSYISTQAQNGTLTFEVIYDRPVEVQIIQYIEGDQDTEQAGFTEATVEVLIDGVWQPPPLGYSESQPFDTRVPFQIIDFMLPSPLTISGIRLTGTTETVDSSVSIAELDALAAP
jgi:ADP-ribosylglycohydrolase